MIINIHNDLYQDYINVETDLKQASTTINWHHHRLFPNIRLDDIATHPLPLPLPLSVSLAYAQEKAIQGEIRVKVVILLQVETGPPNELSDRESMGI